MNELEQKLAKRRQAMRDAEEVHEGASSERLAAPDACSRFEFGQSERASVVFRTDWDSRNYPKVHSWGRSPCTSSCASPAVSAPASPMKKVGPMPKSLFGSPSPPTGTGRVSTGSGRLSTGTARLSTGTGRVSIGTGRVSTGSGRALAEYGNFESPAATPGRVSAIIQEFEKPKLSPAPVAPTPKGFSSQPAIPPLDLQGSKRERSCVPGWLTGLPTPTRSGRKPRITPPMPAAMRKPRITPPSPQELGFSFLQCLQRKPTVRVPRSQENISEAPVLGTGTWGSSFHELFLQTRALFETPASNQESAPMQPSKSEPVFFVPRLHGGRRPSSVRR